MRRVSNSKQQKATIPTLTLFIVLLFGLSPEAHAWKLGDPISKVLEDGGKDIERGLQNLGKAAEDVVTLGEAGRRRDKERAEHEREIAQMQRQQAEQAKQEAVKRLELQLAYTRNTRHLIQRSLVVLTGLQTTLKTNLKATHLIAQTMGTQSLEFSAQTEIITLQYIDLAQWIEEVGKMPSQLSEIENEKMVKLKNGLQAKLAVYVEQLHQIPKAAAEDSASTNLEEVLDLGFQALEVLSSEIQSSQNDLKHLETELSSLDQSLLELKNNI